MKISERTIKRLGEIITGDKALALPLGTEARQFFQRLRHQPRLRLGFSVTMDVR